MRVRYHWLLHTFSILFFLLCLVLAGSLAFVSRPFHIQALYFQHIETNFPIFPSLSNNIDRGLFFSYNFWEFPNLSCRKFQNFLRRKAAVEKCGAKMPSNLYIFTIRATMHLQACIYI